MLLVVRREGGAHMGYNSFRSALELLDMVGKLPCLDFHEEKDPIVEQQEEKQRELIKRTVADAMREAGRAPEAPSRELIDQADRQRSAGCGRRERAARGRRRGSGSRAPPTRRWRRGTPSSRTSRAGAAAPSADRAQRPPPS